jgi:hypothetical protein
MIREDKQFARKVRRFLFATATASGNQLCAATGTVRKEVDGAYSNGLRPPFVDRPAALLPGRIIQVGADVVDIPVCCPASSSSHRTGAPSASGRAGPTPSAPGAHADTAGSGSGGRLDSPEPYMLTFISRCKV